MNVLHRLIDAIIVSHPSELCGYVASLRRGVQGGPTLDEARRDYQDFIRDAHYLG